MPVEVKTFPDQNAALCAAADHLTVTLRDALRTRDNATLGLSGGRTAKLLFPLIATADLAWSKVTLTLIDERWVEIDHPDSNQGLVDRYLRVGSAAATHMIGLKTSHLSPEESVVEVESRLGKLSWPLDAILLGMGEDGHIASLFPGNVTWSEDRSYCIPIAASRGRQPRMSLTPNMLLNSRINFLILLGKEKRRTFELASQPGSPQEYPVRLLLHQDRTPVTVFLAD